MLKSKKRIGVLFVAALTLLVFGVAGFAQKHFMLATAARPEVKIQLAGAVERNSSAMPLEKTTVVNPGEILDWTITSENAGNAVKRVPAPVSMYTEIRYEWADPLAQGGKLAASYKVLVK